MVITDFVLRNEIIVKNSRFQRSCIHCKLGNLYRLGVSLLVGYLFPTVLNHLIHIYPLLVLQSFLIPIWHFYHAFSISSLLSLGELVCLTHISRVLKKDSVCLAINRNTDYSASNIKKKPTSYVYIRNAQAMCSDLLYTCQMLRKIFPMDMPGSHTHTCIKMTLI